ncbi:MAG: PEP-CTERM sorting domain-containing protein [Jaaginema sp. PMC 1079.18]|nr:PEP-CTERM sorting domain-containing protein [Jaaginema sp. PMC 1080.18]MEC4851724.1 PEP-CTERM sorting domain-containing protein [Jaaginema sp. PMC 1079.18]MEC4865805.1 PEP-CTERM sorting domain-containing protein [Jaaginema sp. PMC 1078.18]
MKTKLITSLLAATTVVTGLMSAEAAQAFNLKTDRSDVYDYFYNKVQAERSPLSNPSAFDFNALYTLGGDVTLSFLTEGGTYANYFKYDIDGGAKQTAFGGSKIASNDTNLAGFNTQTDLTLGQTESLGSFAAGTTINPYLNGKVWGWSDYYVGADESQNEDGLIHAIAYEYFDGVDNWVGVFFEDIIGDGSEGSNPYAKGTSDRDFNDAIFVFKGVTTKNPADVPEPTATVALLGLAGAGFAGLRRRQNKA